MKNTMGIKITVKGKKGNYCQTNVNDLPVIEDKFNIGAHNMVVIGDGIVRKAYKKGR